MKKTLLWMDFIIDEEKGFWFSSGSYNGLFYFDKKKEKIYFLDKFPIENKNEYRLFSAGIKCENKLFFAPYNAESIFCYDIIEKRFHEISLYQGQLKGVPFRKIIKYGDYLNLVSSAEKSVVIVVNINTYHLEMYTYKIPIKISNMDFITRDIIQVGDKLIWGIIKKNLIIEFDLNLKTFKIYEVPIDDVIGTIAIYKNFFWISGQKAIYQWDSTKNIIKVISDFPKEYGMSFIQDGEKKFVNKFDKNISKWGCPFIKSEIINNEIIFFAAETNISIVIDLLDEKIEVFEKENNENNIVDFGISTLRFLFVERGLEGIYTYSCRDNKIKYMPYCKKVFYNISYQYDKDNINYWINTLDRIWPEEEIPISILEWVNIVTQKKLILNNSHNGKLIYEKIR